MSKKKTYITYATNISDIKRLHENKYFNAFMNSFKINDINDKEERFILKKLYSEGTIAGYFDKYAELPIFAPYVECEWDLYDEPSKVRLLNTRQSPLIPSKTLCVDEDVVLGYLMPNKKGVKWYVDLYTERICQIEEIIQTNLQQQRTPYLVNVDKNNVDKGKDIINQLLSGQTVILTDMGKDSIQAVLTQAPYLVDKLYIYENNLISELETMLGIDNSPQTTMNAGLSLDQVNANNNSIRMNNQGMLNYINKFCDKMNELFGTNMHAETTQELPDSIHNETDYEGKEGDVTSENFRN